MNWLKIIDSCYLSLSVSLCLSPSLSLSLCLSSWKTKSTNRPRSMSKVLYTCESLIKINPIHTAHFFKRFVKKILPVNQYAYFLESRSCHGFNLVGFYCISTIIVFMPNCDDNPPPPTQQLLRTISLLGR